jgi:hypothetical protein
MTVDTQCQKIAKRPPVSPSESVLAAVQVIYTPISEYILGEADTFLKQGLVGRQVSMYDRLRLFYEGRCIVYIVTGVVPAAPKVQVVAQTEITATPRLTDLVKQYLGTVDRPS